MVSFSGVKRPGRGVDHPPNLEQGLKEQWSYTSIPPGAFCTIVSKVVMCSVYYKMITHLLSRNSIITFPFNFKKILLLV
jgi:hypothetical protein